MGSLPDDFGLWFQVVGLTRFMGVVEVVVGPESNPTLLAALIDVFPSPIVCEALHRRLALWELAWWAEAFRDHDAIQFQTSMRQGIELAESIVKTFELVGAYPDRSRSEQLKHVRMTQSEYESEVIKTLRLLRQHVDWVARPFWVLKAEIDRWKPHYDDLSRHPISGAFLISIENTVKFIARFRTEMTVMYAGLKAELERKRIGTYPRRLGILDPLSGRELECDLSKMCIEIKNPVPANREIRWDLRCK